MLGFRNARSRASISEYRHDFTYQVQRAANQNDAVGCRALSSAIEGFDGRLGGFSGRAKLCGQLRGRGSAMPIDGAEDDGGIHRAQLSEHGRKVLVPHRPEDDDELPFFGELHGVASNYSADMARQSNWDPYLFTGECEQARFGETDGLKELAEVQRLEFEVLFDYCWRQSELG